MYFATVFIAIALSVNLAWAGPGHDHSDAAPTGTTSARTPRVTSHSDLFELVALVNNGELVIYLDRYASNEPVTGATIAVESGSAKGAATAHPDGTYRFTLPPTGQSGTLPISFTVAAGQDTDLLAADLVLPNPGADDDDASHADHSSRMVRWLTYAGAAGAIALLVATGLAFRRHRQATTLAALGAGVLLVALLFSPAAYAGPGHDHGDSAPEASGNAPQRLADGSVFLPKSSQRQLALRTVMAEEKSLPSTVELTGRVVSDPNSGGKVQATQTGRLEAGPRGLPQLGQAVRKGETLAVVRAASGAIERANQIAQTTELSANLAQARKRVARLEQLEGSVAQKDIDAARGDADSLAQRLAAVSASENRTCLSTSLSI